MKLLMDKETLNNKLYGLAAANYIWANFVRPTISEISKQFFHEIHFDINDTIYPQLNNWLLDNSKYTLFVNTYKPSKSNKNWEEDHETKQDKYVPGDGWFLIKRNDIVVLIYRYKTSQEGAADTEHTVIRVPPPHKQNIKLLFDEIILSTGLKNQVHYYDGNYWKSSGFVAPVSFVPSEASRMLDEDVGRFLVDRNRKKYKEKGMPYRRGYLLHGPPGTGKSKTVSYISQKYEIPIYIVGKIDRPRDMMEAINSRAMHEPVIMLIEDIDLTLAGNKRGKKSQRAGNKSSGAATDENTFRHLLNSLDGVEMNDNFLLFATTNKREKLDEALLRPGRIDMEQYFGKLEHSEQLAYINYFYNISYEPEQQFSKRTIAELHLACMENYDDVDKAASSLNIQQQE